MTRPTAFLKSIYLARVPDLCLTSPSSRLNLPAQRLLAAGHYLNIKLSLIKNAIPPVPRATFQGFDSHVGLGAARGYGEART